MKVYLFALSVIALIYGLTFLDINLNKINIDRYAEENDCIFHEKHDIWKCRTQSFETEICYMCRQILTCWNEKKW